MFMYPYNKRFRTLYVFYSGEGDTVDIDSDSKDITESTEWAENEIDEEQSEIKLSRTSQLLLDYKQFRAARLIQAYVRGYLMRRTLRRQQEAAIIIQQYWRRFQAQRYCFAFSEHRLQSELWECFNRCATKIQACYRGYWVRSRVNDMTYLSRVQTNAIVALLNCISHKLHGMMREGDLPGIYSLRNSECFEKVEELLGLLNYRFYNNHMSAQILARKTKLAEQRKLFQCSHLFTETPYYGFNYLGFCKRQPEMNYLHSNVIENARFINIRDKLLEAMNADAKPPINKRAKTELQQNILLLHKKRQEGFCKQIVNSIKNWTFLEEYNITISPNTLTHAEMQNFLAEVQYVMKNNEYSCDCHRPDPRNLICLD